jgi:hypothetical protein
MTDWLQPYVGHVVVCDLDEYYLVIGTLAEARGEHLVFTEVDLHDHREANSTKEVYIIETRKVGVRANRKRLSVPTRRLVAISRLDEVAG